MSDRTPQWMHEDGRVAMHPAYEWTCNDCGRNNFESCIEGDLTPEEREEMGIDENIRVVSFPESVRCKFCEHEFATESHDAEWDEDGDE